MTFRVFISYAKKDTFAFATALDNALGQIEGLDSWMDHDLHEGRTFDQQIEAQLAQCDLMLVLLSPDVNRSTPPSFVRREIQYAQKRDKKIIPLLAQHADIPLILEGEQYTNLVGLEQPQAIQRVVDLVCGHANLVATSRQPSPPIERELPHTPSPNNAATLALPRINPFNPYHWGRLLYWILLNPAQIAPYRQQNGQYDPILHRAGTWLISTIVWLPFLIPLYAASLTFAPLHYATRWPLGYAQLAMAVSTIAWVLFSSLASLHEIREKEDIATVAFISLAGGMAGIAASNMAANGLILATAIASITLAGGVAMDMENKLAFRLLILLATSITLGAALGMGGFFTALLALLVMAGAISVLLFTLIQDIQAHIRKENASPHLIRLAMGLCVLYPLLIWVYWLNGWQVLT